MDQIKIGKFIAQCRKEQNLTQALLAERLGISDRAVSKWETGKNMPDASMMPELCAVLKINLNELFSGERLNMENYKEMAEQHLLELHKLEKTANKKLLALETVIGCVCTASFVLLILAVSLITMALLWKIALVAAGIVIFAVGLGCCIKIEHDAGYYECPECGKSYVPDLKSVIFAPHIGRVRKMTCPYCGKRAYQKKVLTKEN